MACKGDYAESVKPIMSCGMRGLTLATCSVWLLILNISYAIAVSGRDCGVCLLTLRRNYVYMPSHGQTQTARYKSRSATAAGMPEPTPGEGVRSAFFGIGLLRLPRFGSGEVRDGSPGPDRRPGRQCQRSGIWVFTSIVLPGATLAGIRGPGGAGAAETRAPARSQTGCGGDGFYRAAAIGRFVLEGGGTGSPDRRPLWAQGPSPQHRTRVDAAGKKTELIDTGNATLREAYEQLRCHVLAVSPGGGCFSLSVLLREGVAAWIGHCAASPRPASRLGLDTVPCSAIAPPLHAGIVQILATIALNRIQEIHP